MPTPPFVRALTLLGAAALTLAACSSSSSPTTTTQAPNPATAPAQIAQTYETLFNFTNKSVAGKIAVIQDGASVQTALKQALASPLSNGTAGARIDSTTLLTSSQCKASKVTSPCASVVYDLLTTTGTAELSAQKGYAVYVGGTWLVAKATICVLLDLFYNASGQSGSPPGC